MQKLHIDIETYSSINIKDCGAYKYVESKDFKIILIGYAFNDEPVEIIDLADGDELPKRFTKALLDESIQKWAHNATFERLAFAAHGFDISTGQWFCTMVKAAYCGYPLGLDMLSKAMQLGEYAKSKTGTALIKYFCQPCKPTKANGGRTRNLPWHDYDKWEQFKEYCAQDVVAERAVDRNLGQYELPRTERKLYLLDQKINDRGVLVDLNLAKQATIADRISSEALKKEMIALTGLDNPNSPAQLKKWLSEALKENIATLAAAEVPKLIEKAGAGVVSDVLNLRLKSSKTSVKKYIKILSCACKDKRVRGLIQFYGAFRTGRWAGRLIQVHNLPRNYIEDLAETRDTIASGDYDLATILYDDISDILSQLIRTTFIAEPKKIFGVADFSAIEARVIAWLAGETWRLDVFNTHGKIYEASASIMFGVPIEQVTKTSDYRYKGKIAELALGYQGGAGALKRMGGESMGLSEKEMKAIVIKWRKTNKKIVRLWKDTNLNATRAMRSRKKVVSKCGRLEFKYNGEVLTVKLPSGRKLFYQEAEFYQGMYGQAIRYKGINSNTKQWSWIDTYGGKLVENIVQAIARDLLAVSMMRLDAEDFKIVMHVHDEAICEIDESTAAEKLEQMCEIMSRPVAWAEGLPLNADGYITPFYKKD